MKREEKLQELKEFLLNNFTDEFGDLDISGLDFSDFDGVVNISNMKVKSDLIQDFQEVEGNLYQHYQVVEGFLYQDGQEVKGNLIQNNQEVEGDLLD